MQLEHARPDRVLDLQVVTIISLIALIILTYLCQIAPEPWLDGFTEAMQAP